MAWHDPQDRHPDPSADEFARWLSPEEAFEHLQDGVTQSLVDSLLMRLKDGKLVAAADEVRWRDDTGRPHTHRRMTINPPWWMGAQNVQHGSSPIWTQGDVTCVISDDVDMENYAVNFYGVKFDRAAMYEAVPRLAGHHSLRLLSKIQDAANPLAKLQKLSEPTAPAVERTIAQRSNRGRPPKPIWDEMWAEIAAQVVHRELLAFKQADIEAAMSQWLSDHDEDAGESTVRESAGRLWRALTKEARKYPL